MYSFPLIAMNFKKFSLFEEEVKHFHWQKNLVTNTRDWYHFKSLLRNPVFFLPAFVIMIALLDLSVPVIVQQVRESYQKKCVVTETIINPIGKNTTVETQCPKFNGKLP
jgi:surface polysaccharide O-acyltransferase-like enzyme